MHFHVAVENAVFALLLSTARPVRVQARPPSTGTGSLLSPMPCWSTQAAGPSGSGTSGLPPHVYAIATSAYRQMIRDGAGQAILVG